MSASNNNSVTHQYVGPYFVPHGWTVWNNQTAYQPLAVVSYNLAWYILKKPAPVGTLPTEQEYWAQVDNWQGQLAQIVNEINAISNKIKNLPSNRNFIIIGDSYGLESNVNNWVSTFKTNFKNSLFNNMCINGASAYAGTYLTEINNAPDDETVTDVIIAGGANDITAVKNGSSFQAVETSLKTVINAALSKYPNATIWVGFIGTRSNLEDASYGYDTYIGAKNAYINACSSGAKYMIGSEKIIKFCCYNGYMDTIRLHPSLQGAQYMGNALAQIIISGEYNLNTQNDVISLNLITPFSGQMVIKTNVNNSSLIVETGITNIMLTESTNIGVNAVTMANITNWRIFDAWHSNYDFQFMKSDGTIKGGTMVLYNNIMGVIANWNANGAPGNIEGVLRVIVPGQKITIPIDYLC